MGASGETEPVRNDPERRLRSKAAESATEPARRQYGEEGHGGSASEAEPGTTLIRRLMEDAAVGFALFSPDLRYQVVNQRLAEMTGVPATRYIGRTVEELALDAGGRTRQALQEVIETDKPLLDHELSGNTASMPGQLCSWSASWYPLHARDGRLIGVSCVVTDKRERTLEALRISQTRLELAQATAGVPWDWDMRTNEVHCSPAYGALYGLPPGNRAPPPEKWLELIHPEDRDRVREEIEQTIEGGDDRSSEFRVVWPDGTIHWLFGRARVLRDRQGNAVRVLGVNLDITGRKEAEQALRESEARFREMADTAPVMIFVSGPDKLATFFNKGWLSFTGRTIEESLGLGWTASMHPEDVDRTLETISSSFEARRYCHVEFRLQRADGEYRWMLCNGVPRFESDGAFAGYIGCVTDITDLKRTHEEALARQKLESLGQLARSIAHDFNNLLGSIVADSEVLQADLAADSPAREAVERIKLVAARAGEIVRELMAFAGEENTASEPTDMSALVGEMLQLLKASISKSAVLQVDLPANLPAVWANAAQLRQVVLNLILNASEALGDKNGVISVSVAHVPPGQDLSGKSTPCPAPEGCIRLQVSDTGGGIAADIQASIFDPFFTTKNAGRGLGLATVLGVVRSLGGTIDLVSAPGKGSRFEILLPCAGQIAPGTMDIAAADSARNREGVAATVLLVEDEETLRLPVVKVLCRRGFSVVEASNGHAAVELFRAKEPEIDVVLLDLTLPSMSGPEVLEEMRRMRPDVKVILTSAYGQEMVMKSVGGQPPWGYIRKPYSPNELADLLWTACRQHGNARSTRSA